VLSKVKHDRIPSSDTSCLHRWRPPKRHYSVYHPPPFLLTPINRRVRTLTGKEIELDIEPDYKVARIKERVEEKEGIPPVQQRLIFGGKQM